MQHCRHGRGGVVTSVPGGGLNSRLYSRGRCSDNVVHFSFKPKKRFIGTTISGVIRVNDDSVVIDSDLPGLVTTFVSEDKIRNVMRASDNLMQPG